MVFNKRALFVLWNLFYYYLMLQKLFFNQKHIVQFRVTKRIENHFIIFIKQKFALEINSTNEIFENQNPTRKII
jgi:hypothetical protein